MRARRNGREALLKRCVVVIATICLVWAALEVLHVRTAIAREAAKDPAPLGKEKIFITSIQWTSEWVLAYHWVPAVVGLAKEIGRENVFVSICESGSLDDTKGALRWLDELLEEAGISRRIILDNTTHLEVISEPPAETGWIKAPHGEWELRRIPYLAEQRNLALQPLYDLEKSDLRFDKILFLNDVVFDNHDVSTLLSTRDGNFAAACSMDFKNPSVLYDTFALRDSDGHEQLMLNWPYFRSKDSREALKANVPVPVRSCWNGMVAMDAAPFYTRGHSLAFRGIPDSLATRHVEGSECCLVHADNPLSETKGVWLNPNVRVGYNERAYKSVNPQRSSSWVSSWAVLYGSEVNRLLRWVTSPRSKEKIVMRRVAEWERKSPENVEPGAFCLIDEMQILTWNGWAHIW